MSMNPEIKQAWIDALLSGEYEQGRSRLRTKGMTKDQFCCLGVLCELAAKAEVIEPAEYSDSIESYYYDHSASTLPVSVQEWAGMDSDNPQISASSRRGSLAEANDDGMPFSDIAQLIERKL